MHHSMRTGSPGRTSRPGNPVSCFLKLISIGLIFTLFFTGVNGLEEEGDPGFRPIFLGGSGVNEYYMKGGFIII